jgi:predicted dinucleotide-binding enzyme
MKVTIIGAGNMGRGIGTRAVAGGHEVEIIDNDPEEAAALAEELGESAVAVDKSSVGGEIVVLAEELARALPSGTPVVKAFNTTFATTLVAGGWQARSSTSSSPPTTRRRSRR